jgi:DNA-directed RNA polymerase sigma subunit (sigma70/sigma32)
MLESFDARTKDMMMLHIEGHTLAFIGEKHKISRERVRQILEKAKKQIIFENNWDCS